MGFFTKKKFTFTSPVKGKLIPLEEVKDEVFASGMMGSGFAINPEEGEIYAPYDATIKAVFPTNHAYGLVNNTLETLIHIGIDTVNLNGTGFSSYVNQGNSIQQNNKLGSFDIDYIVSKGLNPVVIIIFPNKEKVKINKLHTNVDKNQIIEIEF
ncbi:PTS system glucose-specific IIA component [Breznakia sp. PF5-3]|uniref:PTS sugar transporter subunit IIA n=1 Tax=unclassified Breznakia TaxID=2623764 RepID=UPI002404C9BC|nr:MULTISPECIES: PTS glucose transporter subunit IIA [unclassified Breznakia]MDF9825221.1 PTS system glucose-specific IIA component [Breznakia sp. PM6-1]MDF9836102.1 PTS system glucose-specific IIA component [Breznakia sp. PF5-3]MDF9838742.1 PTS system glucose-specific IIA component [Breznakia sp. PFB2-8]MDF9860770.1 PTS system glucose-specific IIA component [Breznakia sp. PH5-24]